MADVKGMWYTGKNEGNRAWGALKRVLSNRGLGIKANKCLYEGLIVPTAFNVLAGEARKESTVSYILTEED